MEGGRRGAGVFGAGFGSLGGFGVGVRYWEGESVHLSCRGHYEL